MSKYFLDTEFIENGASEPIEFISIGIVSEEGKEYYAVSNEFDESRASDWVKKNVISKLDVDLKERKKKSIIAKEILKFIGNDKNPIFIADYGSYDWVVFCQLFGTMMDLPKNFPMWIYDLQQLKMELNVKDIPKQKKGNHNALEDAKYNKKIYEFLKKKPFNARTLKNEKTSQKNH